MKTRLRRAHPDDAALLHRLIGSLAEFEEARDQVEVSEATLRAQLASEKPPFEALIADNHVEPVGFVLFFASYSTWRGRPGIWIDDLFVLPEHRGQGHGAALLDAVVSIARERGSGRVEWSVLNWNKQALAFYAQRGAEPLTEWTTHRLSLP